MFDEDDFAAGNDDDNETARGKVARGESVDLNIMGMNVTAAEAILLCVIRI